MPNPNRPLRVFLCHASGDKPAVINLYERLVKDGIDAWLDKEKLIPGQNWQIEIPKAVKNSDVVIVCLSSQSVTKEGFVQKEIRFALDAADEKPDETIFIIPARLENCGVPERLSKYHWVDLFSDDGYGWLLKALQIRADNVGAVIKPDSTSKMKSSNESDILPNKNIKSSVNKPVTVAPQKKTASPQKTGNKKPIKKENNQDKSFLPIEGVCVYFSSEYLISPEGRTLKEVENQGLAKQGILRLTTESFVFSNDDFSLDIKFKSIKSIETRRVPFWLAFLVKYISISYIENKKDVVIGLTPVGTTLDKKMVSAFNINRGVKDWLEFVSKIPELAGKINQ